MNKNDAVQLDPTMSDRPYKCPGCGMPMEDEDRLCPNCVTAAERKPFLDLNGNMVLDGYVYLLDESRRLVTQITDDAEDIQAPGRSLASAMLRCAVSEAQRDFYAELTRRLDLYEVQRTLAKQRQ